MASGFLVSIIAWMASPLSKKSIWLEGMKGNGHVCWGTFTMYQGDRSTWISGSRIYRRGLVWRYNVMSYWVYGGRWKYKRSWSGGTLICPHWVKNVDPAKEMEMCPEKWGNVVVWELMTEKFLRREWLPMFLNCQVKWVKDILGIWWHGEVIGNLGCLGMVRTETDRNK